MVNTKPTLLIVDDDASIRDTLTLIFTELGYCVRSASEGFAALAQIHESTPDILLSDLNMPGMSGFELLSVVRRIYPEIHVIAMSGAFSGKSVPHGVAADGFYEKASGLNYLLDLVRSNAHWGGTLRRSSIQIKPLWMLPTGRLPSKDGLSPDELSSMSRSISEGVTEESRLVRETGCLHCHNTITYAIVPPNEPVLGFPSQGIALVT
jgi:CheY-like chemotaxis protein